MAVAGTLSIGQTWHVKALHHQGFDYFFERNEQILLVTKHMDEGARQSVQSLVRRCRDELSNTLRDKLAIETQFADTKQALVNAERERDRLNPADVSAREHKQTVVDSWLITVEELAPRVKERQDEHESAVKALSDAESVEVAKPEQFEIDLSKLFN